MKITQKKWKIDKLNQLKNVSIDFHCISKQFNYLNTT